MVRRIPRTIPEALPPVGSAATGGTVRLTGTDTPIILGAAGDTQLDFEEQANGFAIRIGSNANVFTDRIIFNSADHANAFDTILLDGDGTTARLTWDDSGGQWLLVSSVEEFAQFKGDGTSASLYYTLRRTGGGITALFGHLGSDDLFIYTQDGNVNIEARAADLLGSNVAIGAEDTGGTVRTRAEFRGTDGNIYFRDEAGGEALVWNDTVGYWTAQDIWPVTDVAFDLGSATQTWRDLFVDGIKDRAGVLTYDVQNAEFETAHSVLGGTGDTPRITFNDYVAVTASYPSHLMLGFNAYGFGITAGTLNYAAGSAHDFYAGTTPLLQIETTGIYPGGDQNRDLGSATLTWNKVYAVELRDPAGTLMVTLANAHLENQWSVGTLDPGTPDGQFHVHKASAGAVTAVGGTVFTVEDAATTYISLLTPDGTDRGIIFGNPTSNVSGSVIYTGALGSENLQFRTRGNTQRLVLEGTVVRPGADATQDLGNATYSFKDIFLTGGINDGAGTQMAAIAELGELTDGSTTTLHAHAGTELVYPDILLMGG